MKKIFIILFIFILDRSTKIYLINLQETGVDIDFYILPFLNFYLMWNTGIGFGLVSLESNIYYHILTDIIPYYLRSSYIITMILYDLSFIFSYVIL